jgi:hypothetical protein
MKSEIEFKNDFHKYRYYDIHRGLDMNLVIQFLSRVRVQLPIANWQFGSSRLFCAVEY